MSNIEKNQKKIKEVTISRKLKKVESSVAVMVLEHWNTFFQHSESRTIFALKSEVTHYIK